MNGCNMSDKDLILALRGVAVETGSLLCLGCGYEHSCGTRGCAIIRAAAERLEALTAPPTAPLTLDELREMDDGWIWIELLVPIYGAGSGYYLKKPLFSTEDKLCAGYPGMVAMEPLYSGYGEIWLAYRRKPEEGQHECRG